jgi:hypothetical protein
MDVLARERETECLVCSHKNSAANFPGGQKMNSDAVDTWFGDLVTQKNCSFAGEKMNMLVLIQSCCKFSFEYVTMRNYWTCARSPEVIKNDVEKTMRFQRKKKGEEQRKARGVTPPCPHTPFNLPRNIPGSGVIRRMIGACFSHRLFSFLFSFSFFFRESSRATQHSKNVQGVPSGSNAASGYLWTHRPTELPSLLFTFVCIILTLLMKKMIKPLKLWSLVCTLSVLK